MKFFESHDYPGGPPQLDSAACKKNLRFRDGLAMLRLLCAGRRVVCCASFTRIPHMRGLRFLSILLLLSAAWARAQLSKKKTRVVAPKAMTCAEVCDSLAKAIQNDPQSLTTRLEDALVISEACTPDIVATAIATVNGDPLLTRKIIDTAQNVLPWRRREIEQAASLASIPAAVVVVEPQFEVRRPEQLEVRRALVPSKKSETPIEEVRRALVPVTKKSRKRL